MARRLCASLIVLCALALGRQAGAADPRPGLGADLVAQAAGDTPPPEGEGAAAPGVTAGRPSPIVPADELSDEAGPQRPADLSYGVAARLRWVSVPAWMLNLFTKRNVPLSSWGTGIELFRRKGNFDVVASFSYQNMSPPDGNWLGSGSDHPAATDTNFVQFQNLALYGLDVSFIWHSFINDWFGLHYGAGFGLGIVGGHILRTIDNDGMCTEGNAGDITQCHPANVTCQGGTCDSAELQAAGRFVSGDVPPVIPIINMLAGVDFRLPRARGWEGRIEGGFYDAFYLGGGVGYTF